MASPAGTRENFSGNLQAIAPTGGVVPGGVYLISGKIVVSQDTQSATVLANCVFQGAVWANKQTTGGKSFIVGQKCYYDPTNKVVQPNATGNTLIDGFVMNVSAQADTTVCIYLAGDVPATTT